MLKPEESDALSPQNRILQIIAGALVFGLVMFLSIVLLITKFHLFTPDARPPRPAPAPNAQVGNVLPVISVVAFVMAAITLPLSLVVPGIVAESACKQIADGTWEPGQGRGAPPINTKSLSDVMKLAMVNQMRTIIALALVQSAGFFAVIAYLLEGKLYVLGLAVFLIVLQVLRFPTRGKIESWIDDRLGRIEELRHQMS